MNVLVLMFDIRFYQSRTTQGAPMNDITISVYVPDPNLSQRNVRGMIAATEKMCGNEVDIDQRVDRSICISKAMGNDWQIELTG